MPHGDHRGCAHFDTSKMKERDLWRAIFANMLLTIVQFIGGFVSGSLALMADALHNLSDAASLLIAMVAVKIGKRPPDKQKTFGYKRAETIAALINLVALIAIGLYLCGEAIRRFFVPEDVIGWPVVIIAGVGLIVDIYTAVLTYRHSKDSMNMRAAFLHNLTDAVSSVGVIIAGLLIIYQDWVIADTIMTLIIAGYVLWHGFKAMPKVIHLLMEGAPEDLDIGDIEKDITAISGVKNVHKVHAWHIDETRRAFEAHITVDDLLQMMVIKKRIKKLLKENHNIDHSTLEFETTKEECSDS